MVPQIRLHNQPRLLASATAWARLTLLVFTIAEDTWLRTVPVDRESFLAMTAIGSPDSASRNTPRYLSVNGLYPSSRDSAAKDGSMTRPP